MLMPLLLLLGGADPAPLQAVTLKFAAQVGGVPFSCSTAYRGLGTAGTTATPTDFRFYVHAVRLVRPDGQEVPLALEEDGLWQREGVALLDFEDGTGSCANGTAPMRAEVRGMAPEGPYTGVRFTLGLPFELNHRDLTKQMSPLNVTSLFWAWRSGYKFLRLDLKVDSPVERLFVHLGSTGCQPEDTPATAAPLRCLHRNTAEIAVSDFDPATSTIVTDVAALLAGADLTRNQEKSAKGCMSAPDDRDCAPIFEALGVPFDGTAGSGQRVFRAASTALGAR